MQRQRITVGQTSGLPVPASSGGEEVRRPERFAHPGKPNSEPEAPRTGRPEVCPTARLRAFTLLELLIVIGIIGVLAATSVPAIRSLTQSQSVAAAHRQVLDELDLARHLALSGRRTVYMVFVPPTMRSHFDQVRQYETEPQRTRDMRRLTNLVNGQFTAYALFTKRTVGDQPGRGTPRYLSEWKQLPDGMLFVTNKFEDLKDKWLARADKVLDTNRPLPYALFPFPGADSAPARLPYIAFNADGQITYEEARPPVLAGEAISLTRGSILHNKEIKSSQPSDPDNWIYDSRNKEWWRYNLKAWPDVVGTEKGTPVQIRVSWMTGRAKVERAEVK